MVALGLADHPTTGKREKDLPTAKHLVDILDMLKRKTEGNRTEEETKVLQSLLFDLRMRYVEQSRAGPRQS